ncbi:MAG TPA: HAD-IA family hydrolase [Microthrixaceae bacterium]|nr:HAD-IA family hydrolase [Microthrixaceae bacterium]MCB9375369.1 HAD-IA family hydrolase [Microthrixaceae bacterium]MCB9400256.1 HAD-IA family hydrolase [Microthrixaceae bacterium]MCO5306413.1 HAD-IA family hydrolase [Microthrixaceae bacterium]HMU79176.1 HAD-IA family hydrolase [Microthrixaceae bacterium]
MSIGAPVVAWDLGNVIIPWNRRDALARFVDDEDEIERISREVFDLSTNLHLDRGATVDEVRRIVEERHPGHGWVVDGYVEHFRHSLGPADEATVALIDELLHVGVRCVGLSNWSAITWAGITDAYPALGRLEGVMISGEEGHCKPDEVIFRRCESRFGFTADQVLFFDDSTANVEGARAVGWDAEVFTTARAARAALVRRGLLSV